MEPIDEPPSNSLEHKKFRSIRHYLPIKKIYPAEYFVPKDDPLFPLFEFLYKKNEKLYKKLPKRKNGDDSFLHPLNLLYSLRRAQLKDPIDYCIAISHDYVEELVSLFEKESGLKDDQRAIKILDGYEDEAFEVFEEELKDFCKENNMDDKICYGAVDTIIKTIKLLTRHKRHYYYKSLSAIFNYRNDDIKRRAITIKLADAIHNLHTIESFDAERQLYTGFKGLFILNNTKKYLLEQYGEKFFTTNEFPPVRRLFSKCSKATFDAFLRICIMNKDKGIIDILYILQLAFKKYVYIKSGLVAVTDLDPKEIHPMKLYQGVILKYDHRLHQEFDKFEGRRSLELEYCKNFFKDFDFSEQEFSAIMDYKDAYAMREVVARLLYQPDFYISRFICSELTARGRIKRSLAKKGA